MKRFHDFIKWFLYITTGILIVCAVNYSFYRADTIPQNTLWQILLSGFVTALVTTVIMGKEITKKTEFLIRVSIHYLVLCAVMILLGHSFGWLNYDLPGILMMMVSVAVVYLLNFAVYYVIDSRQADEINRTLREKYQDEE